MNKNDTEIDFSIVDINYSLVVAAVQGQLVEHRHFNPTIIDWSGICALERLLESVIFDKSHTLIEWAVIAICVNDMAADEMLKGNEIIAQAYDLVFNTIQSLLYDEGFSRPELDIRIEQIVAYIP